MTDIMVNALQQHATAQNKLPYKMLFGFDDTEDILDNEYVNVQFIKDGQAYTEYLALVKNSTASLYLTKVLPVGVYSLVFDIWKEHLDVQFQDTSLTLEITAPVYSTTASGGSNAPTTPSTDVHTYTHHQTVSSTDWRITHNLGRYPDPVIMDTAGTKVVGDVKYVDKNTLIVTFSKPFSGRAELF